MSRFDVFLEALADHEEKKIENTLSVRQRLLVNAGIQMNWMGDFLANPAIKYKEQDIPLQNIRFTGTNPAWNRVLLDQCDRSIAAFQQLVQEDENIRHQFEQEASYGTEPILLIGPDEEGFYLPLDGMHRLVGAALQQRTSMKAFVTSHAEHHLPICEAHVVYDLIRAYQRNARDEQGGTQLYHALCLLIRTYANVPTLLRERFGRDHVAHEDIQEIIERVLADYSASDTTT